MVISGYLVEKFNDMGRAYTCRRLVEEAAGAGVRLSMIGARDCIVGHDSTVVNRGRILEHRDFVINRYKEGDLIDAVNALAPRRFNSLPAFRRYVNKFRQMTDIVSEAFTLPRWLMANASADFDAVVARVGLPFVMKGLESSMGREIFLIGGRSDYDSVAARYPESKEWLFEEYIAESRGRDLRLFAIGGEAVAAMCRRSDGDFRANVALGAGVTAVPIDDCLRTAARDVSRICGLDFVGIDLLFGNDGYKFCEINVMPGLEGIESASGLNIARLIIDHIVKETEK